MKNTKLLMALLTGITLYISQAVAIENDTTIRDKLYNKVKAGNFVCSKESSANSPKETISFDLRGHEPKMIISSIASKPDQYKVNAMRCSDESFGGVVRGAGCEVYVSKYPTFGIMDHHLRIRIDYMETRNGGEYNSEGIKAHIIYEATMIGAKTLEEDGRTELMDIYTDDDTMLIFTSKDKGTESYYCGYL